MANARKVVDRRIQERMPTYGVNTGFGALSDRAIALDDLAELQRRLILSNAAGVGPLMADGEVRCMMLLKVASLATGWSGARPELADASVSLLNAGMTPCVPSKGSVGASGDLAPLAHVGAALMGVGKVHYSDQLIEATDALRVAGLAPLTLAPKEGLALVNGTQLPPHSPFPDFLLLRRYSSAALSPECSRLRQRLVRIWLLTHGFMKRAVSLAKSRSPHYADRFSMAATCAPREVPKEWRRTLTA